MFQQINSFTELIDLPNGTLLRWQASGRESVAYLLRQEHERGGDQGGGTAVTLSLSPGPEWDSLNPADELIYPVDVILLGRLLTEPDFSMVDVSEAMGSISPNDGRWPGGENPLITDFGTQELISGGTYPRDVALQAAAQFLGPVAATAAPGEITTKTVFAAADAFVAWLSDDAHDADPEDTGAPGYFNSEDVEQSGYFVGGPWTRPAVMSTESAAEAMTLDLAVVTEKLGLSTGPVSRIARSLAALGWKR